MILSPNHSFLLKSAALSCRHRDCECGVNENAPGADRRQDLQTAGKRSAGGSECGDPGGVSGRGGGWVKRAVTENAETLGFR